MSNKSFVVQYAIKARDQFSAAARKTAKSSEFLRKSIEKTKRSFADFAQNSRRNGAIITATVTAPILLMAKSLKDAARDAQETSSKFDIVFEGLAQESQSAADNLVKNFGLSGTAAKQMLGDTGDLLSGFGFTKNAALDLSTQVNELAVDLFSLTNFSGGAKGASDAITKALLGEREGLVALGIKVREVDVKRKIATMRAKGHIFATKMQAQAVATLAIAVEQSGNAIGNFSRTSHELANQERITSSRIQDLKESFGNVLLPMALTLTKAIRSMVLTLQELSPGAKKAILVIAGIAAVVGPLLLIIGGLALALPAITAAFAVFGGISLAALTPIMPIVLGIAAAAELIRRNWGSISAFFGGIATSISSTLGPTVGRLVDQFMEAAGIIVDLFSPESESAKSLMEFANLGELIGTIIGGSLDVIIRGISGFASILGQTIGAITTLDFSQFDIGAIKAQFLGPESELKADIGGNSKTVVDVNVGLDGGLKQTEATKVTTLGARRSDVGHTTAGAR